LPRAEPNQDTANRLPKANTPETIPVREVTPMPADSLWWNRLLCHFRLTVGSDRQRRRYFGVFSNWLDFRLIFCYALRVAGALSAAGMFFDNLNLLMPPGPE